MKEYTTICREENGQILFEKVEVLDQIVLGKHYKPTGKLPKMVDLTKKDFNPLQKD